MLVEVCSLYELVYDALSASAGVVSKVRSAQLAAGLKSGGCQAGDSAKSPVCIEVVLVIEVKFMVKAEAEFFHDLVQTEDTDPLTSDVGN